MKNEKLAPRLRFGEFEDAWYTQSLNELLDFKNGINADKDAYGSGYKFINVLDIINNDYITHDKIIGSVEVSEKDFNKNIVEYGDILFQRSSETRAEVGQSTVYLDENRPATFGGFVIRGKKIGDYDPAFLNFLLKTARARKEITSKSGGSTRYNVGQATLSEVKILTPTLPEQQKIADFLSKTDKSLQLLQDKKDRLEQYKKGVMQKLFSRELRFKDEKGEDFPDWEEKRLGDLITVFSGGTPKSTNKEFYNGDISFIKSGEIGKDSTEQKITKDAFDACSSKMVKKGDLLMAIYGATSGELAIAQISGAINQAILCIRGAFNKYYLMNYLRFNMKKYLSKYLQGGQGNLSGGIVKSILVNLPTNEEQQKIADFLIQIDRKIEKTAAQAARLEAFKKGLLQQMFV